jgi:hypothetical protein
MRRCPSRRCPSRRGRFLRCPSRPRPRCGSSMHRSHRPGPMRPAPGNRSRSHPKAPPRHRRPKCHGNPRTPRWRTPPTPRADGLACARLKAFHAHACSAKRTFPSSWPGVEICGVDQRPGWAGAQCIAVHGTGIEPRQTVRYSNGNIRKSDGAPDELRDAR